MKTGITLIFASVILLSLQTEKVDNKNLLVGHWKLFAYKYKNDKAITFVSEDCSVTTLTFANDQTYEERKYCITTNGRWFFNKDQTKLGIEMNGYSGTKLSS